ncbi:MAG: hypothetical protein AAF960_07555 [Bacteroidota bacterium]
MKRYSSYRFSLALHQLGISLFLLFLTSNLLAQSRTYRQYATQAVEVRLLANNEALQRQKMEIERFIHQQTIVGELPNITIPVVFHIVHHEAVPSISISDVLE